MTETVYSVREVTLPEINIQDVARIQANLGKQDAKNIGSGLLSPGDVMVEYCMYKNSVQLGVMNGEVVAYAVTKMRDKKIQLQQAFCHSKIDAVTAEEMKSNLLELTTQNFKFAPTESEYNQAVEASRLARKQQKYDTRKTR